MRRGTAFAMRESATHLVVLDTMWGGRGPADDWFPINPDNHSGRRLYRITGAEYPGIWVTNACPERASHARQHGMPNPEWLAHNLDALPRHCRTLPLLVCGRVAQQTFQEAGFGHGGPVIKMLHPAARTWTKAAIIRVSRRVQTLSRSAR